MYGSSGRKRGGEVGGYFGRNNPRRVERGLSWFRPELNPQRLRLHDRGHGVYDDGGGGELELGLEGGEVGRGEERVWVLHWEPLLWMLGLTSNPAKVTEEGELFGCEV